MPSVDYIKKKYKKTAQTKAEIGQAAEYMQGEQSWSKNMGMLGALAVPLAVAATFFPVVGIPMWAAMLSAGTGALAGAKLGEEIAEYREEGEWVKGEEKYSKGDYGITKSGFAKEIQEEARSSLMSAATGLDKNMVNDSIMAAVLAGVKVGGKEFLTSSKIKFADKFMDKASVMEKFELSNAQYDKILAGSVGSKQDIVSERIQRTLASVDEGELVDILSSSDLKDVFPGDKMDILTNEGKEVFIDEVVKNLTYEDLGIVGDKVSGGLIDTYAEFEGAAVEKLFNVTPKGEEIVAKDSLFKGVVGDNIYSEELQNKIMESLKYYEHAFETLGLPDYKVDVTGNNPLN